MKQTMISLLVAITFAGEAKELIANHVQKEWTITNPDTRDAEKNKMQRVRENWMITDAYIRKVDEAKMDQVKAFWMISDDDAVQATEKHLTEEWIISKL